MIRTSPPEHLERVTLVDARDVAIGWAPKLLAHRAGLLHRAFSVFVVNEAREILLQRRAAGKYHSAGLWSNTACGHPRPGEGTSEAASRRLREEMGFSCTLEHRAWFTYRVWMPGGLCEHELDHVLIGRFDGAPRPDPSEVSGWRWMSIDRAHRAVDRAPHLFTPWFPMALEALGGSACGDASIS